MVKQNTAIISNQINQNTNIIYNQFSYDEGCGDDNDNNFDEIIKFNSLTRCKDIVGVDLINDNAYTWNSCSYSKWMTYSY